MSAYVSTAIKRWWHAASWKSVSTEAWMIRSVFGLWIVAFALKHVDARWDLAWHFRFLRDDLIPPHLVNLSGNMVALTLLCFQFYTNIALERRGFLVLLAGFALFITALPFDLLNHCLFGLDVTMAICWRWRTATSLGSPSDMCQAGSTRSGWCLLALQR